MKFIYMFLKFKLGEPGSGVKSRGSIQDFNQLHQQCLDGGYLFEDPEFPANTSSIFVNCLPRHKYEWKRPWEICKNPCLFVEGFSRFDLVQGKLGDCWFVAAAANLTLNKRLFHRVVPVNQSFEDNYAGIFHFRFWYFGHWVEVVIDDRLPTLNGELVFLHSSQKNEFWSPLLEKAYAKLYGSYEALNGGLTSEGMEDLTGGICEIFDIRKAPPNLLEIMLRAFQRSSIMGCYIEYTEEPEEYTEEGLVTGHAYSITKVCNISYPQKVSLIRIRNPWGNDTEWNGPWSDKSKEWLSIGDSIKEKLGLTFENDGEFWMSFEDFLTNFTMLEICNLDPILLNTELSPIVTGKRWEAYQFEGSWVQGVTAGGCTMYPETFHLNPQYVVTLENGDEGDENNNCTLIVGLMQKTNYTQRIMRNNPLSIGFEIYRLDDPEKIPKPLNSRFFKYHAPSVYTATYSKRREITERFTLAKGTYCIIPATHYPNETGRFIIRLFTEKRNNIKEHDVEIASREINVGNNKGEQGLSIKIQNKKNFKWTAGKDQEIDWMELKKLLGGDIKEEFSMDVCRSLIAMMDFDRSGKLSSNEYNQLWRKINYWKEVFKLYDKDNSGYLNVKELREALKSVGYQLNKKILFLLAYRYAGRNGEISFDDFIMCVVRLEGIIDVFEKKRREEIEKNKRRDIATFSLMEWLETTLYS